MLILAIDTSSVHGGVALLSGERILAQECGESAEPSASGLFRRVASVLKTAGAKLSDVECFAVAAGPGSFTGVRVGLAAVKGWAEVWQRPIAAVSVLEAVAAAASEPRSLVAPLTDARRGLLFCGLYRRASGASRDGSGIFSVNAASGAGSAGSAAVAADPPQLVKVGEEFIATPAEILDWVPGVASEPPLFVTTSAGPAVALVSALAGRSARIEVVSPELAPIIGKLGLRRALRGECVDALGLNANYIQRSAAEVNWKEPA